MRTLQTAVVTAALILTLIVASSTANAGGSIDLVLTDTNAGIIYSPTALGVSGPGTAKMDVFVTVDSAGTVGGGFGVASITSEASFVAITDPFGADVVPAWGNPNLIAPYGLGGNTTAGGWDASGFTPVYNTTLLMGTLTISVNPSLAIANGPDFFIAFNKVGVEDWLNGAFESDAMNYTLGSISILDVPEPGTAVLVSLGLGALAAVGRRHASQLPG